MLTKIKTGTSRSALLVLFILFIISACDNKTSDSDQTQSSKPEQALQEAPTHQEDTTTELAETEDLSSSWQDFIIDYDDGWVSAQQTIKIRFAHDITDDASLEQDASQHLNISPKIESHIRYTAKNEISISPSAKLDSGKIYSIALSPEKLQGIPADLGQFTFQIQTLKQDFELKVSGLVPGSKKHLMQLEGSVRTGDIVDLENLKKTLRLMQDEKALDIEWEHAKDGVNHQFSIKGIQRKLENNEIVLLYTGSPIGVEKDGHHPIEVPAINQFSVTAVRTYHHPKQYIEISFSEPLDRNQNLNGLVRLNGASVNVRVDGSFLRIYPAGKASGKLTLEVDDTIESTKRLSLAEKYSTEVTFVSELPGVRFTSQGSIIPPTPNLTVPFEAINVNAVWVTAFKIFDQNIQQYIQGNHLDGGYRDSKTGRFLWRKKVSLPSVPYDEWQRFDIDIKDLLNKHKDGIVNLEIRIDQSTIAYNCPEGNAEEELAPLENYEGPNMQEEDERPTWFYEYYSKNNGYVTYDQRRDPCHSGFYSYWNAENIFASKSFIVSDIGLIVKKGSDNTLYVTSTGLKSGKPLKKTSITVFNYQHQLVGSAVTDKHGFAIIDPKSAGFYLIAENKNDRTYLRLPRNEALPTSQFDTGGTKVKKGLKGFIYGERDVWRPGDDIFLTFVLQDQNKLLPANHPVSLDLFDPRGTKVISQSNSTPVGDLYTFNLKTEESSPTGNWRAVVKVGGEYFDKVLKVETITPNRLKVELTPAERPIHSSRSPIRTELFAQWLNGATARNLKADTELKLSPKTTQFNGWSQFHFDDPASEFTQYRTQVFNQQLDDKGRGNFNLNLKNINNAPGKLRATFVTRIFEQSGNFSTAIRNEEVLPFDNWVGLNIPKGSGYRGAIARNKDHTINIVSINSDAKTVSDRKLNLSIYRIGWRWWWDQSEENLANYVRGRHANRIIDEVITTDKDGRAEWTLEKNHYRWGRHLIRICDELSGHCSGKEVYLGWSWQNQVNPNSATQLMLGTDKERYQVGEIATINLPEISQGTIFYSLENGSEVIARKWLDIKPGDNSFTIPVTEEMAPNVYANVMLILPHQDRESDAPIRLYGITPLLVDNPESHLTPVIEAPDTVKPASTFEVTVSEKENKKMSYTLAVVDEGLLGITGYKAPNPHTTFYKRESLGVLTWDVFDSVLGAYGANLERLLRIGGGDKGKDGKKRKERRFPPVVRFLGAFTVNAGQSKTHKIELPQYMGAVRVMVVAADDGAYGKAEQSVTVTQPLTLLATLPRVLGPNEKVSLPVNVFVNNEKIKDVDVTISTNNLFTIGKAEHTLHFDGPGDQIALLQLHVRDQIGKGRVTVKAQSGDEVAEQTIHIESRSPNTASTVSENIVIQPGETWSPSLLPNGMDNTNLANVTVSSFPPLDLDRRLGYLIRYPHGCVEQTTSAIFPQIFLDKLTNLSTVEKDDIQIHVEEALKKYRSFQLANGAFSYWPGADYSNDWSNTYVTHFLIEAKDLGYAVPTNMLDDALQNLRNNASAFNSERHYSRLVASYRLYVLARAGNPELTAMNRLREELLKKSRHYDDNVARWLLSLAYQSLGLKDVATELLGKDENTIEQYRYSNYTYGSSLRDMAMLLMGYHANEFENEAWDQAKSIAQELSSQRWYSTHSTSWAFIALSNFADGRVGDRNLFSINEGKDWQNIESLNTVYKQSVDPTHLKQKTLQIRNDSERPLHASISNTGIPAEGKETAEENGLKLSVRFTDINGTPLDVSALPQGQDLIAEVAVSAIDTQKYRFQIEDIALSMIMPSGWQIRNERLEGDSLAKGLDYQDIRDDRVLSYFSLWKNTYWYYRYNDQNHTEQSIKVILNASYAGRFYLPGWHVASMYDEEINASTSGQWVNVVSEEDAKDAQ